MVVNADQIFTIFSRKIFRATQIRLLEIMLDGIVALYLQIINFDRDIFQSYYTSVISSLFHKSYMNASLIFLEKHLRILSWLIVAN